MKLDTKDYENKMKKTIEVYKEALSVIRAGRANSAVISRVTFEYYGAPTEITSMADVKVTDPKTLVITPYDASTLKAIEKALLASDVGITPMNDGKVIRLVFPQLTEERRKEINKNISKMSEEAKVAVRNIRRDAMDKFKKQQKASEITEDDYKNMEKDMQKKTDDYIKKVDELCAKKEKELSEI